jgi:enediyne biosynthesis protein E4
VQFNEVRGGSSYLSQNDLRLHFGLGSQAAIDTLEISWPSGKKDLYKHLPADFIYTISEDGTIQKRVPFNKSTVGAGGSAARSHK